jgi:hypothetical protein
MFDSSIEVWGRLVMKIDSNLVINFIFDGKVIFSLESRPRNYALISLCDRWVRESPPKVGTGPNPPLT